MVVMRLRVISEVARVLRVERDNHPCTRGLRLATPSYWSWHHMPQLCHQTVCSRNCTRTQRYWHGRCWRRIPQFHLPVQQAQWSTYSLRICGNGTEQVGTFLLYPITIAPTIAQPLVPALSQLLLLLRLRLLLFCQHSECQYYPLLQSISPPI